MTSELSSVADPLSISGMPVVCDPFIGERYKWVPKKQHPRPRTQKKWIKRFGFKSVKYQIPIAYTIDTTKFGYLVGGWPCGGKLLQVSPPLWEALKDKAMQDRVCTAANMSSETAAEILEKMGQVANRLDRQRAEGTFNVPTR